MWAVCLTACCLTLWLYNRAFIIAQLSTAPQTNSHIRLIKSSIENVFVERKEIFYAENTFADNSLLFVFPKSAALTPTQIVSVFVGLYVCEFIFNRLFNSFSLSC